MYVTVLIYKDDNISNVNNSIPTSSLKHMITASSFRFLGAMGYAMNTLLKFRHSIYMTRPCRCMNKLGQLRME